MLTPQFTPLTRNTTVLFSPSLPYNLVYCNGICDLICLRNIEKDTLVQVGQGISPSFPQVLELLIADGEFLAFAPDTDETNNMIHILSLKFPLLPVQLKLLFYTPFSSVYSLYDVTCFYSHALRLCSWLLGFLMMTLSLKPI